MKPMGGVKPFDPNNPGATLAVDITVRDMLNLTEDYDKLGDCLSSFLNKGFLKKDPLEGESPKVLVTRCDIIACKEQKYIEKQQQHYFIVNLKFKEGIDLGFQTGNEINFRWQENDRLHDRFKIWEESKTPVYLVTLNGSKVESGKTYFKLSPKAFFIIPENGTTDWADSFYLTGNSDNGGFALKRTTRILLVENQNAKFVEPSMGSLMLQIEDMLANGKVPQMRNHTPQDIAKHLGYEIPDNYAPGQGVEKKKA